MAEILHNIQYSFANKALTSFLKYSRDPHPFKCLRQ